MRKNIRLVFGIGFNDANYQVQVHKMVNGKDKIVWRCPYYQKWVSMLRRCYSKRYQEKYPTYRGCTVYDEWLTFSNFKKWMVEQDWEGRQLDKDFLVENNKVYSEATCVFLPSKVNSFILTCGKAKGEYPLGVHLKKRNKKNPYVSQCNDGVKRGYLGHFPNPEESHQAWLVKKLEICKDYIIEFKDEPLVHKGLIRIRDKIQCHIKTNTELLSF